MDSNRMIRVEHLTKEYMLGTITGTTMKEALLRKLGKIQEDTALANRSFTALHDVNLEISRGEAVGLIGSNGAGKSTLLKLLSRITSPSEGTIYLNGRVASMLEVGTGFHPELTGRENIYLNGSILGMTEKEIGQKIDSIIAFSECQDFIDTPVKRYSSGMYVKLAFSVAAHLDSEIMIMDEVLAVGDEKFQNKCLKKMKEIAREEHRTILYVSHNMETIRQLCTRGLVLDHGELVFDGDVEKAISIYRGEHLRSETVIDLEPYIRPAWLQRTDVRLTRAEYCGLPEKVLRIRMKWQIRKATPDFGIRVELIDRNRKPFAAAVFYHVGGGAEQTEGEKLLEADISCVENGTYTTFYTVFAMDHFGNSVDLDNVEGLDLNVNIPGEEQRLIWRNESWGNIQLNTF